MALAYVNEIRAIAAVAAASWDPAALRRELANVFCNAAGQFEICRDIDGHMQKVIIKVLNCVCYFLFNT
jgi:hypothetical protein